MSLTLKVFRELTKNMNETTVINTSIEFGNEWSLRGTINCIHIAPKEYSYSDESYISLTQHKEDSLIVRELLDKNEWKTKELKND